MLRIHCTDFTPHEWVTACRLNNVDVSEQERRLWGQACLCLAAISKGSAKLPRLIVYPEFSFQEIGNLSSLFRWGFDTRTVVVSGDKNPVRSEEGFAILPDITYEEFCVEEYDCLILPGCSDIRQSIRDEKLMDFLRSLEGNETFPIGAICAGPLYLAKAGLLKDKKFTNSMYLEMNERLPFIDMENIQYQPVVEDGNVITAQGDAYRLFAVAMARKVGYQCSDHACFGVGEEWKEEDFVHHLSDAEWKEFEEEFADLIR